MSAVAVATWALDGVALVAAGIAAYFAWKTVRITRRARRVLRDNDLRERYSERN